MTQAPFPPESSAERRGDDWLVVVAAAAGSVSLGIVPVLMGLFSARFGLDRLALGYIASAESGGVLLGTLLALLFAVRGRVATGVAAGAVTGVAGSLLTLWAASGSALLASRISCGVGVGLILGLGNHALSRNRFPERAFARLNLLQGILAAFASVALPWVAEVAGYPPALVVLTLFFAAVLFAIRPLSQVPVSGMDSSPRLAQMRGSVAPGLVALGALACFEFGAIALWSSVHAFGVSAGMSHRFIGLAVAIGGIGAIVAGLAGSRIGLRWGRFPMLVGATVAMCAALLLMINPHSPLQFAGALLIFNAGWTIGLIYCCGLVATLAQSAFVTGSLAFTIVAAATASPATTVLLTHGSLRLVLPLCATACLFSLLLALIAIRSGKPDAIHLKS